MIMQSQANVANHHRLIKDAYVYKRKSKEVFYLVNQFEKIPGLLLSFCSWLFNNMMKKQTRLKFNLGVRLFIFVFLVRFHQKS